MVGIASPIKIVKLAVSRLEKDADTWLQWLNKHRVDFSLGNLDWWDFKNKVADFFNGVDCEFKPHPTL